MNAPHRALQDFLDVRPTDVAIAVVGGIAVAARTEPRFTRDLDFAVAVADDAQADAVVFALRQRGYVVQSVLQNEARGRVSTVRLKRGPRTPIVDLLFAASGIETEVAAAAEEIELAPGLVAPVARVGHLIAMKLVSRDDDLRPQDRGDLAHLAKVADAAEWTLAEAAVETIHQRGFNRGRDLRRALAEWRGASPAPFRPS